MKESQMLIDGYDKKDFGILPRELKCGDVDFSYGLVTYHQLAHDNMGDIKKIVDDDSPMNTGSDEDVHV